jgi:hypothetical protein
MGKIKLHAGDWGSGSGDFKFGVFSLPKPKLSWNPMESVKASELETVEMATEESVKKIGGTVGWGVAGAALLGPVGLLAGLIGGGRKKEVTFVAKFEDGRKLLGTTDNKTYIKIQAAIF